MPNLSFNILTFDHPEPNKDFFFVTEKQEGFFPLRNFRLPANVSEILGIDDLEKEVPLYTNFLEDVESDLKLTVSLEDSPEFALHYCRTRIFDFFIQEKLIAKFNYINDIEVWLEAKDVTDNETTYFHKIGLRVQFARVSDKPELLFYYIGKSRIVNESLATLENEISTTNYKKVLYKNRVYSYQKGLPDYVLDDMEAAFPMVNYDLINTLELESGFEKIENRYIHIHKYIKGFYIKYLSTELDGIPWKLKPEMEDEMIFGVGAFINQEIGVRFLGNTFCFSNDGLFKEFECYAENELFLLAGKIEMGILNFKKRHQNKNPKRLIIHFYKPMSDKELKPILKALEKLKTPISVFVVTINKTESEDYLVFDESYSDLMPESGTIINIGRSEYLLCNNSKYNLEDKVALDGYHLPVKLKLSCSKPELLTDEVATELIDQVYQFSRMYWKALKQQNLPVTIKYPEMVARIAPHFDGRIIPLYGRKNLWFL